MEKQKFSKIIDSLDYFTALLMQNYPEADIITINKFVQIIKTKYYYKFWKENEFDLEMIQVFADLYLKVDPITNNYPTLKDKYQDITISENTNINTSGNTQLCQTEPTIKDIKNYIVSILTQDASYSNNNVKTESMNRNLIDDVQKILNLPTQLNFINRAVLSLQPFIYDNPRNCGDCGKCDICSRVQKFDPNSEYYTTIMKRIDEISRKVDYFDRKKQGPQGPEGPIGPEGPEGPQGPKGDPGDTTAEIMLENSVVEYFTIASSQNLFSLRLDADRGLANILLKTNQYTDLLTTNKTLIGSLNELYNKSATINLNGTKPINITKNNDQFEIILQYNTSDFKVDAPDYNLTLNRDTIQTKLIPNGNIEITTDNKIRSFDPSFDNNKFLKDFSLYLATDAEGIEVSDSVLYTTAAINKFYETKADLSTRLYDYQQTTDISLKTNSKTIVGAINELFDRSNNLNNDITKVSTSMNKTLSTKEFITDEQLDISKLKNLLKNVKVRENVLITTPNTRKVMVEEILEYDTKYFITVTWDGVPEGNQITYEYVQTDAKINSPIATFHHSHIEGREPNILQLENTGNFGFRIITKNGLQNTDGFIIKLEKEKNIIGG